MVRENLPAGTGAPTMAPISSIMGGIMMLGVTSDSLSAMELRTLSDWTIRPQIKAISGVANVVVLGGDYKQYQVFANPEKMKHYNVSLSELVEQVKEANKNAPGGVINQYGNQYGYNRYNSKGNPFRNPFGNTMGIFRKSKGIP